MANRDAPSHVAPPAPAMTRIGVVADTHLAAGADTERLLSGLAGRHFADCALILHAGDIVAPELLAAFAPTPVYAVRGNLDPATADTPPHRVVTVAGKRIGLIHGWGDAAGVIERALREFTGKPLDCLVFGHTHEPCCQWRNGLLLFNPGSATQRRRMPWTSVGLLEIDGERLQGRIIPLPPT